MATRSASPTSPASPATPPAPAGTEFIARIALTQSLVAMCIDTMLPALGAMATELGARHENDRQLILSVFFAGLMCGQILYGPISDATGRKPALYVGLALYAAGNVLCAVTHGFGILLAGRAIAGFGAAGPRIVSMALVRDAYAGRGMAQVMSFVSTVFILVPVFAPSIGQAVFAFGSWRVIFAALVVIAIANSAWFALRQPETLPPERRRPFSLSGVARGAAETFRQPLTFGYMVSTGIIFGAMLNYLATAQQVFQDQYDAGKMFPIYFGMLAIGIGVASFVNGALVMRFGMRRLSRIALIAVSSLSLLAFAAAWLWHGHPPLWALLTYMVPCFFFMGIVFGNFNARAMEPMGHIAGIAAAVTGSVSTLVALAISVPFGRAYDGTVLPLIAAYMLCGLTALTLTTWAERAHAQRAPSSAS